MNPEIVDKVLVLGYVPDDADVVELATALHTHGKLTEKTLRYILARMVRDVEQDPCVETMLEFRKRFRKIGLLHDNLAAFAATVEECQRMHGKHLNLVVQILDEPLDD